MVSVGVYDRQLPSASPTSQTWVFKFLNLMTPLKTEFSSKKPRASGHNRVIFVVALYHGCGTAMRSVQALVLCVENVNKMKVLSCVTSLEGRDWVAHAPPPPHTRHRHVASRRPSVKQHNNFDAYHTHAHRFCLSFHDASQHIFHSVGECGEADDHDDVGERTRQEATAMLVRTLVTCA